MKPVVFLISMCLALLLLSPPAAEAAARPPAPRVIDLRGVDGTLLKASYFAAGRPGPGVLLLHQTNRDRRAWDGLAARLAKAGINTLTLDLRGFGDSAGTPHDQMSAEQRAQARAQRPADIDAAWRFLVSQPGVNSERIGLAGAGGYGVNNAIQTAERHPAQVRSMIFLSGDTFLDGLRFLRQASSPELFVVANNDEYPPTVEAMERLFINAASPGKRFLRYPGPEAPWLGFEDAKDVPATGSHGTDLFRTHPDLPGVLVDWFVTTLIRTPGRAPRDPAAAKVLPSAPLLLRLDEPGGVAEVARKLADARRKDPKAQLFPEITVSLIGYDHLRAGDNKAAIDILKLDVLAYPQSADTHGSLSDAYLADGQYELARREAETALALLDSAPKGSTWSETEQRKAAVRAAAQSNLAKLERPRPRRR